MRKAVENRATTFLYSCVVLLLLTCIAVGVSYALFTDEVRVETHLMKAGTLDVTLKRTALTYTKLNDNGYLEAVTDNEVFDFTQRTRENIFGLHKDHTKIAPGSYFEAQLELGNAGDVALDYTVALKLFTENEEQANALAQQLQVTIIRDGVEEEYMLSELSGTADCEVLKGHMKRTDRTETFIIKLEFVNDDANNDAQLQEAAFDLVVTAVQATTESTETTEATDEPAADGESETSSTEVTDESTDDHSGAAAPNETPTE